MLKLNSMRVDLAEKFQKLIDAYNAGIRTEKMARAYAHVYDHYYGAGRSAYQQPVS